MAVTADIQINGSPGSNDNLPLGTLVNLSNVSATPPTTYEWAILSQPEGTTTDVLSSTASATPTFTPTKEGSYLIRLIVDKTLPTEAAQQVIAAVLELETLNRIPAAGETVENDGNTGWANTAVDYILQRVTRLEDSGVVVGQAGSAGLTAGTILRATGVQTIGIDTANQRVVPVFTDIDATTQAVETPELCVLLGGVNGNPAPGAGALIRARFSGLFQGVVYPSSPPTVGDAVFVSDTGTISLTQGTFVRPCGTVAAVDTGAGTYDIYFGGAVGSVSGSPAGNAGGILGYPGSTYPDPNGLSAAAGAIPIEPGAVEARFKLDDANSSSTAPSLVFKGADNTGSGAAGEVLLEGGEKNGGDNIGGVVRAEGATSSAGGRAVVQGGSASAVGGVGGDSVVQAGGGAASGGVAAVEGGEGLSGAGGAAYLRGGYSGTGTGGAATVEGGESADDMGGDATVIGGTPAAGFAGGNGYVRGADSPSGSGGNAGALAGDGIAGGAALVAGGNGTTGGGGAAEVVGGGSAADNGGFGAVYGGAASAVGKTSGSGKLDAGTASGLATAGTADVGVANASAVRLGRSGKPVRTLGQNVETATSVAPVAATTIPVNVPTILLTNAGAVGLLGAHPNLQTADIEAGTRVTLIQTGAGTTTFWSELSDAGSAMRLDNATSVTLSQHDALTLVYTGAFWVQTSLSVNS